MNAIIIIAHGSKKADSNNEFINMVSNIRNNSPYDLTQEAFLELSEPKIHEVTEELIQKGVTDISLYPYFLNSGKHVLVDLPTIHQTLQEQYPSVEFKLLKHFGQSKKIEEIILSDIS